MILAYSSEAKERIRSLPPEVKRGVKEILDGLGNNPYLGKPLQRELSGFWSIAFRYYRIIYKILDSENRLLIYSIGRRKEIYEDFVKGLTFTNKP